MASKEISFNLLERITMKKITCLVTLIVAFCFAICLFGCSSNESSPQSSSNSNSNTETLDNIMLLDTQTIEGITLNVDLDWNHELDMHPNELADSQTVYEIRNYDDDLTIIIDIAAFPIEIEDVAETLKSREGISDMQYSITRQSSVSGNGYITYKYSCNYEGEPCEGAFVVISAPNGQYVINAIGVHSNSDYCLKLLNTLLETVEIDDSVVVSFEPTWHVSDSATEQDQDHPLPDFSTILVGGDAKNVTIQCTYSPIAASDAVGYYYFDMINLNNDVYRADDGSPNGFEGCPVIVKVDNTQYDFFYSMLAFKPKVPETVTFSMADGSDLPDTIYISFHATSSILNTSGSADTDWLDGKFLTLRYD